jgi:Ca2+-binding RTX toxin-like protein
MAKIIGNASSETLNGTSVADEINGLGGYDTIYAGGGDDSIWSTDLIGDYIDGGAGIDLAVIHRGNLVGDITLDLSNPAVSHTFAGTTIINIERIDFAGGSGDDEVIGGAYDDILHGAQGDDYLTGAGGANSLYGGANNDILDSSLGSDWVDGGDGDDVIFSGPNQDDHLDGGSGTDFAILNREGNWGAGFSISLANPGQWQELLDGTWMRNIEQMSFSGSAGWDTIIGGALWDELSGNEGNDHIEGGGGNDGLYGGLHNDTLFGQDDHDDLFGQLGDDELWGGTGNDELVGDLGYDQLFGQAGIDVLTGGGGPDHMVGGADADRFVLSHHSHSTLAAPDDIADFSSAAGDRIDLSAMDAVLYNTGNQAFTFIGTNGFSGVAGQLRYTSGQYVEGDVTGDGVADFRIEMNVASMTSSDFIL